MQHVRIEAPDAGALDNLARQCGELAIGCTEAAGQVDSVASGILSRATALAELQAVMASLETDHRQVADATDEARLLSENARARLGNGAEIIAASIAEFAGLTALVGRLGIQLTGFASAMEQVQRTTQVIDGIARTTNMLALNAAIEAERAGDGGRTFAVVAAEVKKLARDTRVATEEIAATMDSLGRQGESFMLEIQQGISRSKEAERGFARINDTVGDVIRLVDQVDQQTEDIARSTSLIHDSVYRVSQELEGFAEAAEANGGRLRGARSNMAKLEYRANIMFDTIVHSGFATEDRRFVDIALEKAEHFLKLTKDALAAGTLNMEDLFDFDYVPILGSNPQQYTSRLNAFADSTWRPELDRIVSAEPLIISNACSDINGYLPTHTTRYSRTPVGDPIHDAAHCRNRRIFLDDTDRLAKKSNKSFHLAVYRRENDDGGFHVVRNVYVPFVINGRRWGDYEIAYRIE